MGSFSLDMAKFAEKAKGNAETVVRKVVVDLASNIVMRSPVDTGRFRANWITSLESPSNDIFDAVDPTGSGSIEAAVSAASDLKLGQTAYIANNLPYAQRLENGWSKQSPPNAMVGLSVLQFQQYINKAVSELP